MGFCFASYGHTINTVSIKADLSRRTLIAKRAAVIWILLDIDLEDTYEISSFIIFVTALIRSHDR